MTEGIDPGLTPYIVVSNAKAAIEFYKAAFGAVETMRHEAPGGDKIMHARLEINGSVLMLADDFPEFMGGRSRTPESLGGTPLTLSLQVKDAKAAWARALGAGATVVYPLKDQFWGEKYGKLLDPFGHEWSVGQTIRVVSKKESEAAAEKFFEKETPVSQ